MECPDPSVHGLHVCSRCGRKFDHRWSVGYGNAMGSPQCGDCFCETNRLIREKEILFPDRWEDPVV